MIEFVRTLEWPLIARGLGISTFMSVIAAPIMWVFVGWKGQLGLFFAYPITIVIGTAVNYTVHRWKRAHEKGSR